MTEKNKTLKKVLYNAAYAQCREWIRLDRARNVIADYN